MPRPAPLKKSHQVLIRTDDDGLVPEEVGIAHPTSVKVGLAFALVFFLAALGVMIWACVVMADNRPYYASNAATRTVDGYTIYLARAAEPYAGRPDSVHTSVTSESPCIAACNEDANCRFFTYDQTNSKCYMYSESTLPAQFAASAVPGPTQLDADVYVKTGSMVTQLRGVLKDGNQTLF